MINSDNKLTLEPTLLPPITDLIFKKSEDIGELINNLKSDEEILDVNYKNSSHDSESKNFYSSLNNGRARSLNLMMELSNQPRSYNALQNTTSNLKKDFDVAKDYYISQQEIHNKKKQAVRQQVLDVENKLKSSSHLLKSLQSYTLNSFDPLQEKMNNDSLFVTKKILVHMNMGLAQAIAPPVKLLGEIVSAGAHYACDMNDTTRKVCKVTKDSLKYTGKQLLRVMKQTDIVNKAQAVHKFVTVTYPIEMDRRYLIPKETTHQYVQDLTVIVPAVIPIPFLPRFSTMAKPFKGLVNRICETEFVRDVLKMPNILEDFSMPIFALAKPTTNYTIINQMNWDTNVSNILKTESVSNFKKSDSSKLKIPNFVLGEGFFVKTNASNSNLMKQTTDKIYSVISKDLNKANSLDLDVIITNSMEKIKPLINEFSPFINIALREFGHPVKSVMDLKPLHHSLYNSIYAYGNSLSPYIVKGSQWPEKIVSELMGADFLKKMNLQYLRTPTPLAIAMDGSEDAFLIKSFVEGQTISEHIKKLGSLDVLKERISVLDDLKIANYHLGRAVGEFQMKGLNANPAKTAIKDSIDSLMSSYEKVWDHTSIPKKYDRRINQIMRNFRRSPGEASFELGNIYGEQLTWSMKNPLTVGFFDTAYVNITPNYLVTKEFYKALNNSTLIGLESGVKLEEINILKNCFVKGYEKEFIGKRSPQAERFFELHSHLETMENLVQEMKVNKTYHKQIPQCIEDLNLELFKLLGGK